MLAAAVILLALIALLAVPVSLSYRIAWRRAFEREFHLRWLFGLVHLRFTTAQGGSAPGAKPEAGSKRRRRARPGRGGTRPLAAFGQKLFRRRVTRFLRDLWRAVDKRDVELRLRIGLGDPADTGQLWALLGPAAGLFASCRGALIEIEPDFIDAVFELDSRGNLRFVPLRIIALVAGLLLSPPVWRGISRMHGRA